jgi:hypothetical protein
MKGPYYSNYTPKIIPRYSLLTDWYQGKEKYCPTKIKNTYQVDPIQYPVAAMNWDSALVESTRHQKIGDLARELGVEPRGASLPPPPASLSPVF